MRRLMHTQYYLKLIFIILIATVFSLLLARFGVGKESLIMIYLIGVLIITVVTTGYMYGITASIVSVLLFNFFFTHPVHTLSIYDQNDVVLMSAFLIASLISGNMTKLFQKQLLISKSNENTANHLYKIAESFLNVTGQVNIAEKGILNIYKYTDFQSYISLNDNLDGFISPLDIEPNSIKTNTIEFIIKGVKSQFGTLILVANKNDLTNEHSLMIKTVITQMGFALDREWLYKERQNIHVAMEKESIRSNLLRAISHDLRTPLTGIIGASSIITENYLSLNQEAIKGLANDIHEEALWLTSLVENILNMTRIDQGRLVLNKTTEVIDDIVFEAIEHTKLLAKDKRVIIKVPDEVETCPMDSKLIVQVLINLIENAIRHSPESTCIDLRAYKQDSNVYFEVEDDGNGVDPSIKKTLFDSYVTLSHDVIDGKRGMGLGLSICHSIIQAHGGKIELADTRKGAKFIFSLPLEVY